MVLYSTSSILIIDSFGIAIRFLADPIVIILLLIAVGFGFLMGVIPGMGGVTALALIVPLTYDLDPLTAFMLLSAAYASVNFGGSITAILLNTPGASPNAATVIDGYPMTRNGEAGRALGASATASALGAIIGVIVILLLIPIIQEVIMLFGPTEIFWLAVWGIIVVSVVIRGSFVAGIISASIGALLAMHGQNPQTGTYRWDYGIWWLQDGIGLIPVLIGLFALTEMIKIVSEGGKEGTSIVKGGTELSDVTSGRLQGIKDVLDNKFVFFRSSLIGTVIGLIPGVGGVLANFFAYFRTAQSADDKESFGKGDVRGVISSESSNDASANAGFLPTLGFGIPGSIAMVVILGAFVLQGIQPGPLIFSQNMDIVAVIIVTSVIANILVSTFGLMTVRPMVKVASIDIRYIAPVVICLVLLASFSINNNIYDVLITSFFGCFGYLMYKLDFSPVPLVLALVLTPIIETNYSRALDIGRGEMSVLIESNASKTIIAVMCITLIFSFIKSYQDVGMHE